MTTDKLITIAVIAGFIFIFDAIFLGLIIVTRRKVAQAKNWPLHHGGGCPVHDRVAQVGQ